MKRIRLYSLIIVSALILPLHASRADAPAENSLGGRVVADVDGKKLVFPTMKTEITGDLQGDLATITVRQVFANPTETPMNARYLFPLNKDAAVHAMEMQVGDERVVAKIKKRHDARQAYETAKREGKSAALLEQHRPNMFTQDVANLMPGMPVAVTLKYSQVVLRVDGAYELRVPLVVGPRYIPKNTANTPLAVQHTARNEPTAESENSIGDTGGEKDSTRMGSWRFGLVPAMPEIFGLTIPPTVHRDRVSLNIKLRSGVPIHKISSTTHGLKVAGDDLTKTVALDGGTTIDNRDFVMRYAIAGDAVQSGVLTHSKAGSHTFSLLVEPPRTPREGDIVAREMVFVLDTSGSMSGAPMEASKTFMRHALKTLRPADSFRIIRFSNGASEFSAAAVPATPGNIAAGTAFVGGLRAGGGTRILAGLRQAYRRTPQNNVLRIVVFLSDGYVGNEAEILNLVAGDVGKGRLYAFGVGTSINRYLIAEMARLGRGMSRIIDPTAAGHDDAIAFAGRLKTPVLTNIRIDWGNLAPRHVTPTTIPDLFDGDSIRIQGRFSGTDSETIKVHGTVNGRAVTMPLKIDPSAETSAGSGAIPLIWARSRIADQMRELMIPQRLRRSRQSNAELQEKVTALGLAHSLVTQWTSFVAVSHRIVNKTPNATVSRDVPLPMVKGVTEKAYPPVQKVQRHTGLKFAQNRHHSPRTFSGGATPEPAQILGLFLLLMTLGGAFWFGSFRPTRS